MRLALNSDFRRINLATLTIPFVAANGSGTTNRHPDAIRLWSSLEAC